MKKQAIEIIDAIATFKKIETVLAKNNRKVKVTVVGGISIIMQGFVKRATRDIDIALTKDAGTFADICAKLNIPVDIVTIASTVDLPNAVTINLYTGPFLEVNSVTTRDLIKLKLERFYKHDPEDIFAMIDHDKISYENFEDLIEEMVPDFIGNPRGLILSAREVVERKFNAHLEEFDRKFKFSIL